jgi:UDP-N-acetylglucosamine--N-acetylmuramyl-(pentapeptide) pyrophosphoryl-undecaprenol N-acetylglucosamine transferase
MSQNNHGEESIAFAVGGTGGHVLPSLEIAKNLPGEGKRILIGVKIEENPFVCNKEFERFDVHGNNFSAGYFSGFCAIIKGAKQAVKILKKQNSTHVIGMGGFHSLPVLLAALYLKIPITLYEPNLIPGRVNKFFSFFAKKTLVLFEEVEKHLYGPVKLITLSMKKEENTPTFSKQLLRKEFGLDEDRVTILVFGGSRGAKWINDLMKKTLQYIKQDIQVIHLTGEKEGKSEIYQEYGVKAFVTTFYKEMDKAWGASDFAICRAGAGTIKEALLTKTPVLLIPYPEAVNNHQDHNAKFMEDVVGGGVRFMQKDLTENKLAEQIDAFCSLILREKMKKNINNYLEKRKGEPIDGLLL